MLGVVDAKGRLRLMYDSVGSVGSVGLTTIVASANYFLKI